MKSFYIYIYDLFPFAMSDRHSSRRKVIQRIGHGIIGATAISTGTKSVAAREDDDIDDTEVEPDVATGAVAQFDPYSIGPVGESILNAEWTFDSSIPTGNSYTLEIYVEGTHVGEPETLATDNSTPGWDFTDDHPLSSEYAYAWESDEWVYDFYGATRYLDAEIGALESGTTEAAVGVSNFIFSDYATGTLSHE